DESTSWLFATIAPGKFFFGIARGESQMALYYAALRIWSGLGQDEATLRLLSVICVALSVPVMYLVGRRLYDGSVGLLAGGMLATNAFVLQQAQNARAYGMVMLLALLATRLLIKAAVTERRRWWLVYGVTGVLMVLTHAAAILVILAHGIGMVLGGRTNIR